MGTDRLTPEQQELALSGVKLTTWVLQKWFHSTPRRWRDELRGAAVEGLVRAALRYRPGEGTKFGTYAVRAIWRKVSYTLTLLQRHPAHVRRAALTAPVTDHRESPQDEWERGEGQRAARTTVESLLRRLPPSQREAVVAVYFERKTLADYARQLRVRRQTVRYRLLRGLANMRLLMGSQRG